MNQGSIPPFTFLYSTPRIVFGWDSVDRLGEIARELGADSAVIVLDSVFCEGPLAARLGASLTPALAAPPTIFAVPRHEPDTASVAACQRVLAAADADMIVVVGGGSAMDTAKVARMLLANPGDVTAIAGIGTPMKPHRSRLLCVPTTAGTGSEVSESAVISNQDAGTKLIYRAPEMSAHVAVLDPALTVTAPTGVTACSGYDAITHAVEAYVSRMASPMTDPLALSALRLLAAALPIACRAPTDRAARSACLIGACQAAIAFNSANLGLAHALSAPLGALHGVAHGLGNALALPAVTAYNEPQLGDKGAVIAAILDAPTPSAGLSRLRHAIGLDHGLDEFVTTEAARERLAQAALKSGQVKMNPRRADIDHMRAIIAAMRAPTGGVRPQITPEIAP